MHFHVFGAREVKNFYLIRVNAFAIRYAFYGEEENTELKKQASQ